jgi:hypothetical protein
MTKIKTIKPETPKSEEESTQKKPLEKNIVRVEYESGVREYSLEKHGEDFRKIAEGFVAKKPSVRKIL